MHPCTEGVALPYRGMVASSSSMISALCSTPLVARSWLVCSQSVLNCGEATEVNGKDGTRFVAPILAALQAR